MLTGGEEPEDEDSGFYSRILGGTMEDNPNPVFANYDSSIRTHYLKKYLDQESAEGPILDICCSKAPFYPYLEKWGFEGKVFGADLLFHQLETASKRGVNAVQANALHLPFDDGYFAYAIFTDALVHLMKREDQEGVLNEIARVLRPGGTLLMTATNLSFVAMNSLISGRNALKSDYCTYYSRDEIEDLTKEKYRIESCNAFGFYYLIPSFLRRTTGILYAFDRLSNNPLTRKLGIVNFFKLRRVEDTQSA
jgi:ubiquinone/menaquinone biosynthesis C-methylase UbiE